MARNDEQGLPRPLGVLIAVILIGAVIWQAVPRGTLYAILAIATVAILGIAYLVLRKRGSGPFKALGRTVWRGITGQGIRKPAKGAAIPPLGSDETLRLKNAVGFRCENPDCRNPTFPSLVVHHIIPRHEAGSSHKLSNLLVLCSNCHTVFQNNVPGRAVQRQLALNPGRFRTNDLFVDWKHGPR